MKIRNFKVLVAPFKQGLPLGWESGEGKKRGNGRHEGLGIT
jgi:hypothetical protein